jgi:hypothetical protein
MQLLFAVIEPFFTNSSIFAGMIQEPMPGWLQMVVDGVNDLVGQNVDDFKPANHVLLNEYHPVLTLCSTSTTQSMMKAPQWWLHGMNV